MTKQTKPRKKNANKTKKEFNDEEEMPAIMASFKKFNDEFMEQYA